MVWIMSGPSNGSTTSLEKDRTISELGKKLDRATTEFGALVFAKCCKLSMVHLHSDEK